MLKGAVLTVWDYRHNFPYKGKYSWGKKFTYCTPRLLRYSSVFHSSTHFMLTYICFHESIRALFTWQVNLKQSVTNRFISALINYIRLPVGLKVYIHHVDCLFKQSGSLEDSGTIQTLHHSEKESQIYSKWWKNLGSTKDSIHPKTTAKELMKEF